MEDCEGLARLCYLAGQGQSTRSIYDLLFDGPRGMTDERTAAMAAVLGARHVCWLHHAHFLVAEVDGRVAAALSGLDREQNRTRDFVAALRETGWTDGDLAAMQGRIGPVTSVEPRHPDGAWRIENVATFQEYRGRGLVGALLEEIVALGVERGHRVADLGCFISNEPAIRAYERVGFRVTEEFTDRDFEEIFGCPGMCRMTLEKKGQT
ncbi:MAG: GNAT family N-acetyltransferase [Actinobacteria bacterium]|nr:GNAT family N-acetyltransferase [Actinomycetota bacterium]